MKLATSNLVHKLGLGLAYQKQRLRPKLAGVWARGASKIIWDALRIFATVEASNFKFGTQLWFGTSLPINVWDKNWGEGLGQGSIQTKSGTPYIFLEPLKLPTSNLVYNLAYQKRTFKTKIGGGLGQEASKKFETPYLFQQPLKLATEKLVHNMSSGLPCQTQFLGPN